MLFDNLEWWDRKRGERGVQERGDICIPVGNVDVWHKPSQYCNGPLILKNVLFITGNYNAKVGSQEIPGVTGKFGLGVQNEAQQRLTEFCQENTLIIAKTLFQLHKTLHMDITRCSILKSY